MVTVLQKQVHCLPENTICHPPPFFFKEKWVVTLVKANMIGYYSLMDGADVLKELVNILNFHYLISDLLL